MGGEQFVPMEQFRETHDAWQEALVACEQAESRERELVEAAKALCDHFQMIGELDPRGELARLLHELRAALLANQGDDEPLAATTPEGDDRAEQLEGE